MSLFNLFGIRFGWEAVIGLIPLAGDAAGVGMALLLFSQCCKIDGGLPQSLKIRMLINIAIDFAMGLIPFLGDLADAAFKCNTKNLRLLEVCLDERYKPDKYQSRSDDRDEVSRAQRRKNRASGIYDSNHPPPATAWEDFSDGEEDVQARPSEQRRQQQQGYVSGGRGGGGR